MGDSQTTGGVRVTGMNETVLHLKNFHRDIYDVLADQVQRILVRTARGAHGRYPGGAWVTSFGVAGKWPAGEVTTAGGSSRGVKSWSEASPGVKAAIFDYYGRRTAPSSMKTPAARATGYSLQERYGKPQRFLWPAWLAIRRDSMREIERALADAERQLESRIGA